MEPLQLQVVAVFIFVEGRVVFQIVVARAT